MANATNKDIQFHFFYGTGAAIQFKKKSANQMDSMEEDATQSWSRMRDCADHNKKVENVGS